MKKFFTIAFIAALIFNSCMQEEINAPLNSAVAVATMEGEVTKSNVGDGGYFKWAENDAIAIHTTSGVIEGELIDGAGTSSASFRYSLFEGQQLTNYAMYPYNANHEIEGSTLTFVMPAEYNLGTEISNTNAPMLAVPGAERNATATYNFSHLGGVFRFVFKNAPVGTSKLTLSLGGSKINGEFTADLDAETPVLVTGIAEEGENVTTINFTPLASAQDITIYVPVPTGEYTGITAELYNGAEKLGSWGKATAVNTVDRRTLKKMAAITFGTASGDIDNEVSVASEQQLINAVQNSGTVTLTENIEVTSTINILNGKDVTLDLNGNEITLGGSIAVRSGSNANYGIVNYGTLVIKNGTINSTATYNAIGNYSSDFATIPYEKGVAAPIVNLVLDGVTINHTGAAVDGTNAAIKTWGYTSVEISNSTITGNGNALSVDSSKATLSGSTFTGGLYGLHSFCAVVDYEACTISGAYHDMYVQTASENKPSVTYNNVINGTTYTPADATFTSGLFVEVVSTADEFASAVSVGSGVLMTGDVTLTARVDSPASKTTVIDLGGNTLTVSNANYGIINYGALVIKNGTINSTATYNAIGNYSSDFATIPYEKGVAAPTVNLVLDGVTINHTGAAVDGTNAAIKTWGYTSVEISNSTIIGSGNALSVDSSKATLSGSTFTGGLYGLHSYCAVVDYEACTISGAYHDMYVQTASENKPSVTYNNVINGTTYTPADATFASGLFVEL